MKHLVAEKLQCREESSVVLTVLKVHKTLLSTHKHHREMELITQVHF